MSVLLDAMHKMVNIELFLYFRSVRRVFIQPMGLGRNTITSIQKRDETTPLNIEKLISINYKSTKVLVEGESRVKGGGDDIVLE